MQTIFEYCYRDAGNFKVFGSVILDGSLTPQEENDVRSKLESGYYFIAEQVGIPPLYDQLYQWSNGPIQTDHCWHEFVGFEEAGGADDGCGGAVPVAAFGARFTPIVHWDEALSPHFDLSIPCVSCT